LDDLCEILLVVLFRSFINFDCASLLRDALNVLDVFDCWLAFCGCCELMELLDDIVDVDIDLEMLFVEMSGLYDWL